MKSIPNNLNHHIDLHDDDQPVGRILTRREVLALFGAIAGVAVLDACAPSPSASTQSTSVPT